MRPVADWDESDLDELHRVSSWRASRLSTKTLQVCADFVAKVFD